MVRAWRWATDHGRPTVHPGVPEPLYVPGKSQPHHTGKSHSSEPVHALGASGWTAAISAFFVGSFLMIVGVWVRLHKSSDNSLHWVILGSFGGLFMSRQG